MEKYNADMAACVKSPPPTDEQIRTMPTGMLYQWWQLSRRAADAEATATVTGQPIDPCIRALNWKEEALERELQYR